MKENEVREGDIVEIDYIETFTKVHRNEGKAIVIWKDTISHQPLITKLTEYSPIWRVYDEFSKVVGHISLDSTLKCLVSKKIESEQSDEVPWYLKIFNPTVLKEFQKWMRDATPEERQSVQDYIDSISTEVPYNDKESGIHSEVYKGRTSMPIDEETLRDEVLLFLEYYTRSELLNTVIEAIEMHDFIEEKENKSKEDMIMSEKENKERKDKLFEKLINNPPTISIPYDQFIEMVNRVNRD